MALVAEQVGQQPIDFKTGAGEVMKGAAEAAGLYGAQQKAEATKLELENAKMKQDAMKSGITLDYLNKIANSPNPAVQKILKKQYAAQYETMYGKPMDQDTLEAFTKSPDFGAAMQKLIDSGALRGNGKNFVDGINTLASALGVPYVDAMKIAETGLEMTSKEDIAMAKNEASKTRASIYAGNVLNDNKVAQEKFVQDAMGKIRTDQKAFLEIARYAKDAQSAVDKPNGINDQKLINAFAKIIDPTSVVREGEFDRVRSYQNLSDQVRNTLAKYNLKEGMLLDQKTRTELLNTIQDSLNNQMPNFEASINEFSDSLDRAGSDGKILRNKFADVLSMKKKAAPKGAVSLSDQQKSGLKAYIDRKIPYEQFKAKNPKTAQLVSKAEYDKQIGGE
jgi:hypothetical protein